MSDIDFSAVDRRSEPIASRGSERAAERLLVMRPTSFFSNRFRLYVEEEDGAAAHHSQRHGGRSGLDRVIDLNLLLMILLIGVPVLAYFMLSSGS